MALTIEFQRELDGRWIAEVVELPGVLVYGDTEAEAERNVKSLALRVLADELDNGELDPNFTSISFKKFDCC